MSQGSVALALCSGSVYYSCFKAFSPKLLRCAVSSMSCAGEHDRLPCPSDEVHSELDSFGSVNGPEMMLKELNVWRFRSYLMADWIVLVIACQRSYSLVKCGRKQQGLPVRRGQVENAAHIWQKSHVSHTVCFVDDNRASRFKS